MKLLQNQKNLNLIGEVKDAKLDSRKQKKEKYGGTNIKETGQEERNLQKKQRRKIKKKRRIRWPKNFNFENPGERPDPERWLPKYERAKYKKIALKKGILSRNQGTSALHQLDAMANQNLRKNVISTANQEANTAKNKIKNKRKKGKK